MTRIFGFHDPSPSNEYYNYEMANKRSYRTPPSHHVIQVRSKPSSETNYKIPQNNAAYRKKYKVHEDDYYFRAMGPIIRCGQFITLMPIVNCLDTDWRKIKFKWLSFQTFKTIIGLGCTIFEIIVLLKLVKQLPRFSIYAAWAVVFDICGCLSHILLFGIAFNWHRLIREWTWRESALLRPPYNQLKYTVKFKLRLVGFLVLFAAVAEHILFLSQIMYPLYKRNEICGYNRNVLEQVYTGLKIHFAALFDYSVYMLLLSEWINFTMTISWTYVDVLIITMSVALSTRFEQLNRRMKSLRITPYNDQVWNEIREQYIKLADVITYTDRYFGSAIMLSCASNMYFICQQLYNSVKIEFDFPINGIYFWYSLSFVVIKTCAVLFSASRINDLSKESLSILRHISLRVWSIEIERFMEYLFSDIFSLSGLNYFNLTRRFMFGMVGTIITYEILVFDKLDVKRNIVSNLCN